MIKASDLKKAEAFVKRSELAPWLETRIFQLQKRPGRPRQLTVHTVLVGLYLLFMSDKNEYMSNLHTILTDGLTVYQQRRLGCEGITLRQIYYIVSVMVDCVNPSNKVRSDGRTLDEDEQTEADEALQHVLDRLLDASLPTDVDHKGSYAVDASIIESFIQRPHADRDATRLKIKKGGKETLYFGYALHAAAWTHEDGEARASLPQFVERIVVTDLKSGYSHSEKPAVDIFTRLKDEGAVLSDLIADRAYSFANPTSYHLPIRQLGMSLVHDYHPLDGGPKGTYQGAVVIDGWLYSPTIPQNLRSLKTPPTPRKLSRRHSAEKRAKIKEERAEYKKQLGAFNDAIAQRELYALKRHARMDKDGYMRLMCPAAAGKLRCALVEASMQLPLTKPTAYDPPERAIDAVCQNSTITVPPDLLAKTYQKHRWGTPAWQTSYARRSVVERYFGRLKSPTGGYANRDRLRVRGLARTALWLAFYCVRTNLLETLAWRTKHQSQEQPQAYKRQSSPRRKSTVSLLIKAGTDPPQPKP